jgi:undecaprenyl-phosphate 4-deoxy-4-formamido-L-arabinose transferase
VPYDAESQLAVEESGTLGDAGVSGDAVDYSVVVPVYRSENSLEALFDRISHVFDGLGRSFEVIFVEDCGRDGSWEAIRRLKESHPAELVAIRLARNFGQHNATLCGFHHVRGRFVITIDDDLQVPPEEIPKLIEEQERSQAELVYGYFSDKQHGFVQNLGSSVIQKACEITFGGKGKGSSFRLIVASLARKVRSHRQSFVFIDGLLMWYTQYVSRTLVRHEPRGHGESGYTLFKLIGLAAHMFFNFTTLPLRWIIYLGILTSTISFALGVVFLIRALIYSVPVGWSSLAVTIFFVGGVILLVLGIIGEYVSRIFTLHNDRPQFSVKELLPR